MSDNNSITPKFKHFDYILLPPPSACRVVGIKSVVVDVDDVTREPSAYQHTYTLVSPEGQVFEEVPESHMTLTDKPVHEGMIQPRRENVADLADLAADNVAPVADPDPVVDPVAEETKH